MALSRGGARRQSNGLEPYYKRLDPIDGGYHLTRDSDGKEYGSIEVYDDSEEGETGVHIQFRQPGPRNRVAVFHVEDSDAFEDIIEALKSAQNALL